VLLKKGADRILLHSTPRS